MMVSLRLGVKGEVGIGRERREMSRKGWIAKRYLFLFPWNRPREGEIIFGLQLYCRGENGKSRSLEVVRS